MDPRPYLPELSGLEDSKCFLCNDRNGNTDEHVFPKWLQRKYDLWNRKAGLLNDTTISYKSLKVPACSRCNTDCLGPIENVVRESLSQGYHIFKKLPAITLFQWLGKILLGLLYKEANLALDRTNPKDKRTIVRKKYLSEITKFRMLLSSVYRPVKFDYPPPWSVFFFRIRDDIPESYFFSNTARQLTSIMVLGECGIVMSAMENLTIKKYGDWQKGQLMALSEANFRELTCNQIGDTPLHLLQIMDFFWIVTHQKELVPVEPQYRFSVSSRPNIATEIEVSNIEVPFRMKPWNEELRQNLLSNMAAKLGAEVKGQFLLDENNCFIEWSRLMKRADTVQ